MPEGDKILGAGASCKGWTESTPLVGIGLTDLPNIKRGGGSFEVKF